MSHNSSTIFEQPLLAELGPSRSLLLVLGAVYALVVVVWCRVPIDWAVRVVLFALIGGHFVLLYRLHVRPSHHRAVQTLSWDRRRG